MRFAVDFTSSCYGSLCATLSSASHTVFSFTHLTCSSPVLASLSFTQLRSLSKLACCVYIFASTLEQKISLSFTRQGPSLARFFWQYENFPGDEIGGTMPKMMGTWEEARGGSLTCDQYKRPYNRCYLQGDNFGLQKVSFC